MAENTENPEKKIRFADYELDFGRFQLCRNGCPVRLEGLPLQLLMFLIDHERRLVTREQIADALWGKDVFVDVEQGINTAIRKIRIALDDDSAQPQYLQTVVGRGYRFVAPIVAMPISVTPIGVAPTSVGVDAAASGTAEAFQVTPEEFGRAIMAAAGLNPDEPKAPPKFRDPS